MNELKTIWLNNLPLFLVCLPAGNEYHIGSFKQDSAEDVLIDIQFDDNGFNHEYYEENRVRYSEKPNFHHCVGEYLKQGHYASK